MSLRYLARLRAEPRTVVALDESPVGLDVEDRSFDPVSLGTPDLIHFTLAATATGCQLRRVALQDDSWSEGGEDKELWEEHLTEALRSADLRSANRLLQTELAHYFVAAVEMRAASSLFRLTRSGALDIPLERADHDETVSLVLSIIAEALGAT